MRNITNIDIEPAVGDQEFAVYSNISLYRNRRQDEDVWFSAHRRDLLRRVDGSWKLAKRHIFVNHHVFPDENVSVFF